MCDAQQSGRVILRFFLSWYRRILSLTNEGNTSKLQWINPAIDTKPKLLNEETFKWLD